MAAFAARSLHPNSHDLIRLKAWRYRLGTSLQLQIRGEVPDEVVVGEGGPIRAFVDELEGAAAAGKQADSEGHD